MKTMKFFSLGILPLFSFLLFCSQVKAQSTGTNQLGLRFGGFSGITFRHVGNSNVGVQVDLLENYHGDWPIIDVMAEKHIPLNQGFVFYLGGGGFFGGSHTSYYENGTGPYIGPSVGLQAVLGFDYYFNGVPLNLGLDLTPRFSFYYDPFPWDAAISLHYIF